MKQVEQELLFLQRLASLCSDDCELMSANDRHALDLLIARKHWAVQDIWNEGRQLPPLNTPVLVVRFEDFCTMYDRERCWYSDMFGEVDAPTTVMVRRELASSYSPEEIQMRLPSPKREDELIMVLRTSDFMWRVA